MTEYSPRVDKRFYKPSEPIHRWAVVVFETQNRLNMAGAQDVMRGFVDGCKEVGKLFCPSIYLFAFLIHPKA